MKRIASLALLLAVTAVHAQNTPVGVWKTIDDHTGRDKSLVRISDTGGMLTGRVEKLLHPTRPNPRCDTRRDDRHGKPIPGMSILEGLRLDGDVWDGGRILDPEDGRIYTVRLKPIDDGRKLEVRGYIGPFFRTQTWVRVE